MKKTLLIMTLLVLLVISSCSNNSTKNSDHSIFYLEWENSDLIELNVQGYGISETQISLKVLDSQGNLCLEPVIVQFSITSQPGGVTFENEDSVFQTKIIEGIARATIISGIITGEVTIKAELLDKKGSPIPDVEAIETEEVEIISRDPHTITFLERDFHPTQEAALIFHCAIATLIQDINGNPISNGTTVTFSLHDGYEGWSHNDTMRISIIEPAEIGNSNYWGITRPGVAYSVMHYHWKLALESVPIRVELENGLSHTEWMELPKWHDIWD